MFQHNINLRYLSLTYNIITLILCINGAISSVIIYYKCIVINHPLMSIIKYVFGGTLLLLMVHLYLY